MFGKHESRLNQAAPQSIFSSSLLVSRSRPSCPRSTSFVSSTSIITFDHMKKLKNNTFVGNTAHFDNEINLAGSEGFQGHGRSDHIKPQKLVLVSPCWSQCDHEEAFEGFSRTFPGFQKSAETDRQCGDDPPGGNFHAVRSSFGSCRSRRAHQLMDACGS